MRDLGATAILSSTAFQTGWAAEGALRGRKASRISTGLGRCMDSTDVSEQTNLPVASEATATAAGTPISTSTGVIRKPPPMPNRPDTKPTAAPIPRIMSTLTGISAMGR